MVKMTDVATGVVNALPLGATVRADQLVGVEDDPTLVLAVIAGLVREGKVERLKPGVYRRIK